MSIQYKQHFDGVKTVCFTLSLLVNVSFQSQARNVPLLDDVRKVIGVHRPATGLSGSNTQLCIIDGRFDPRSDTQGSLTQSTVRAFAGKDSRLLSVQAHKEGKDHANHVSSIVHSIAKDAELRVVDIYDEPSVENAPGHNARLIAAINAAIDSKVDFINISQRIHPDGDWNGKISKDLKKALYKARDAGIGVIKSAGNDNETIGSTFYTRSLAKLLYKMRGSMILVAAAASYDADRKENLASFSNKAGLAYKYTVTAPGTDILAYGAANKLVIMSGTSMAAPVVTGLAGLLKEAYPALTAKEILKSIRYSARKISLDHSTYLPEGKYGCGVVDFREALRRAERIQELKIIASNL